MPSAGQATLPLPLREDLRLFESAPERGGAPCWVIQDPVSNRFFRIGWFEYECLLRWPGDPARVARDITSATALRVSAEHVLEFARFLEQNRLLRPSPEGLRELRRQANAPGWRHWKWWLHHYLFIRIPLVRPDRLLTRLLPWVQPLFTRQALICLIAATVAGLVLVARQWDVFTHSVLDLISPQGIAGFVLSLAINVSPFMRFDGYFILSDILGFPNLHERAGAMARTWLRRLVLGVADPYPEETSGRARRGLIVFALLTWLYRLVVFLGIAWAVYAMFFKVLGIFLLVVELAWFVFRPIWQELKVWHGRWSEVRRRRKVLLYGLLVAAVVLLATPWRFDVHAPGVAHPARQQMVFSPLPARLEALQAPGPVRAGQTLAVFAVPELEDRRRRADAAIAALERRLAGLIADDAGMARRGALLRQLGEQRAERAAIEEEQARLRVLATLDGEWLDVDHTLGVGSWLDSRTAVGVLVDPAEWVVDAYVGQREVVRLRTGAPARFYSRQAPGGVPARLVFIDPGRSQRLAYPALDGRHGGAIPTQTGGDTQEGAPLEAMYRVRLSLDYPVTGPRELLGKVVIEGEERSVLGAGFQGLASVLIRESGF